MAVRRIVLKPDDGIQQDGGDSRRHPLPGGDIDASGLVGDPLGGQEQFKRMATANRA